MSKLTGLLKKLGKAARYFHVTFSLFALLVFDSSGQNGVLEGHVLDTLGNPISDVNIYVEELSIGTTTDSNGSFELSLPEDTPLTLNLSHVEYVGVSQQVILSAGQELKLRLTLRFSRRLLEDVEIRGQSAFIREQASVYSIPSKSAKFVPSPFGDFNRILGTLPGVVTNNELATTYAVRGGNFDENLVYVNDMPVYRPFLVRAGQQEGLSFVNPDLVQSVVFSAGGWQPRYGDKLSSVLNIDYKEPRVFAGSTTLSLLGLASHIEGASKSKSVSYLVGLRHKDSQYLLNTLEIKGQYFPRFTDLQTQFNFEISKQKKTDLQLLFSYARNRYKVEPENPETSFGTFNQSLRLFVAFDGRDLLNYDTYQGGVKLTHKVSAKMVTKIVLSGFATREREYFDVEGGYRLCDIDRNIGSSTFDECVALRGIGTNYVSGRNALDALVFNGEIRNELVLNQHNLFEWGVGYSHQDISDQIQEYGFIDSAQFVSVEQVIQSDIDLATNQVSGYIQNSSSIANRHTFNYGVRLNYWDYSGQLLISPRLQYAFHPRWQRDVVFKGAMGLYSQPPFYRELRDREGKINPDVKAQSSVHAIAGVDYPFSVWSRSFKFMSEIYYKHLYHVNPYDVNNVRVRYHAHNDALAYAYGADFRVNGEFIKGTESWFSLSYLSTKEDLENDERGFIRRPSDQRITVGIFFEDHFPNDPSLRMYLGLFYGSGLPFGPPNNDEFRNSYSGEAYQRVDIGFSKMILFEKGFLESCWLSAEVLNLLGAENTISYVWIKDFGNNQYAVPNSLSARFLNLKVLVRY